MDLDEEMIVADKADADSAVDDMQAYMQMRVHKSGAGIDLKALINEGRAGDERRRAVLAKGVMRALDEWGLQNADKQTVLGLGDNSRSTLRRYAEGHPLADTRDLLDRASHLLGIYQGLALLYPENPEIRGQWMRSANRRFHGHSPVEVVREYGLPGLLMVRAEIDRMRESS